MSVERKGETDMKYIVQMLNDHALRCVIRYHYVLADVSTIQQHKDTPASVYVYTKKMHRITHLIRDLAVALRDLESEIRAP